MSVEDQSYELVYSAVLAGARQAVSDAIAKSPDVTDLIHKAVENGVRDFFISAVQELADGGFSPTGLLILTAIKNGVVEAELRRKGI